MPSIDRWCFRFAIVTTLALYTCALSAAQDLPDQDPETSAAEAAIQRALAAAGVQDGPSDDSQSPSPRNSKPGSTQLPDYQPFMRSINLAWRTLQTANEFKEPIDKTLDAVDASVTAYSGVVPTTYPEIDRLRDFSHELRERLWALKQKSAQTWIDDSGVNEFQPSSFSAAEAYLDDWSHELESAKIEIERALPEVRAGERIVMAEGIKEVALGTGTTMELLNPEVFAEIISELDAAHSYIEDIRRRLEETREDVAANGRNLRDAIECVRSRRSVAMEDAGAPAGLMPPRPASQSPSAAPSTQQPTSRQPRAPSEPCCAPGDHESCGCEPPGAKRCH
jgi:hypothetical protein